MPARGAVAVVLAALAGIVPARRGPAGAQAPPYDPLALARAGNATPLDLTIADSRRTRNIPIRVYLPAAMDAAPVVLVSHGLGGSREGSAFLGTHWAARGYVVVFLQHPGSDTSVWADVPPLARLRAMEQAASLQNLLLRVGDVRAALDQLERWNASRGHALSGRLDRTRVGMSGHSFGAVTTQAVSGQQMARGGATFTDARIRAAMAMSPSVPAAGTPAEAFGGVRIPWMLMTGTHDDATIGRADAASRLRVFPALPPGDKYELVLDGAEHSAFTDRALPGETLGRNPRHHRAILALGTAFWDAFLGEDAAAKRWLDGPGPSAVLDPKDRWQRK